MRALAERANALIKHFKTLKHVTLDLRAITATALVILTPPTKASGEKTSAQQPCILKSIA